MCAYDYSANSIEGELVGLSDFKGKALLIVNVASKCGFTTQYEGLEKLYRKYKDKGLVILGFPCNQFGGQEPGSEKEIKQFCEISYDVTFPLFSKINVNGNETHPLYRYLKSEAKGALGSQSIKWNFTKFLVDRYGCVVERFSPQTKPEAIEDKIQQTLAAT